jgi:hypothetical protein
MAFLVIVFAWVVGTILAESFSAPLAVPITLAVTLIGLFLYFRYFRKPEEINPEATDYQPVSWGWVWVIVSGLLIVGLGTGLAVTLFSSVPPG